MYSLQIFFFNKSQEVIQKMKFNIPNFNPDKKKSLIIVVKYQIQAFLEIMSTDQFI